MEIKQTERPADRNTREWNEVAFGGNEPFTDGVTPEVVARQQLERDAAAEREKRRLQAQERRASALKSVPLKRIQKELSKIKFNTPITETETARLKNFLLNEQGGISKQNRRGCNFALFKYMRAQFYAGGGMQVLCMKRLWDAADVFRIADMARFVFWKYRKPGYLGGEISDSDLNFSLKRVEADMIDEPEIVALLNAFRDELLAQGVFSENPLEHLNQTTQARKQKHFRVSTVMKRYEEIETRMGELAKQQEAVLTIEALRPINENVAELARRLTELTSHHTTAHGVSINAMNELQKKLAVLTDIVLRQSNRIDALEGFNAPVMPHTPGGTWLPGSPTCVEKVCEIREICENSSCNLPSAVLS
jgi:hypothetical protein